MGQAKTAADAMLEIAYAAFQTHYKVTAKPGWSTPEQHWNDNPQARTLWVGLVKGVLTNTANAQASGLLPALLSIDVRQPLLPGLGGGPAVDPASIPSGLARRLAAKFRGQDGGARTGPLPAAGDPGAAAVDVSPGLAIGRSTECDGPADSGSSGDCGGSDGGGGGGD